MDVVPFSVVLANQSEALVIVHFGPEKLLVGAIH